MFIIHRIAVNELFMKNILWIQKPIGLNLSDSSFQMNIDQVLHRYRQKYFAVLHTFETISFEKPTPLAQILILITKAIL